MPVLQDAKQLARDTASHAVLHDFVESLELVGSNVFYLFVGKQASSVLRKAARIETRADSLKRQIIYVSKGTDSEGLLTLLESVSADDLRAVGVEFLCVTAKKLSKSRPVEDFTRFLRAIFAKTGFENGLVKIYLYPDRSLSELVSFLEGLRPATDKDSFSRCVLGVLDRLGSAGQLEQMTSIITKYGSSVQGEMDNSKIIQRVVNHFMTYALQSHLPTEAVISVLRQMVGLGYRTSLASFNKTLDMVIKSARKDELMESLLRLMGETGLEFNLITYNCILDYYCSNDLWEKAEQLFASFEGRGLTPDNYTFSILLKGVKGARNPDLVFADRVVELYLAHGNIVDLIILNSAIDVFIGHGDYERAYAVLGLIKERTTFTPDHITYSTLIKGACKHKSMEVAMRFFEHMRGEGIKPSRIIYNSLMDMAVKDQKLKMALHLIEEMQRDGIAADGYTYSIILNGLKLNESPEVLVKLTLDNVRKVLDGNHFKLDEALFNTILDVCFKYDLLEDLEFFHRLMRAKGLTESPVTFSIMLRAYSKQQHFEKALQVFEQMLEHKVALNDVTYGALLDACAKIGRMDFCLRIFEYLETLNVNINSIVFTTILKGFIKNEDLDGAVSFFQRVKKYTHLNGMIITFNCALDILVRKGDTEGAMSLFQELSTHFTPDVISYSTLIKGLCSGNRKAEAFDYVKKMIDAQPDVDVSVINLFLDSCSNVTDCALGVGAYEHVMSRNIAPNEITFGVMVKVFGFAKELSRAFDLLDLMTAFDITPSIVVYTNLIHISFYNRSPKKADVAFTLFKKAGLRGDRLMYSKLVDGFIRFKEHSRIIKYVDLALKDGCTLKPLTLESLYAYFHDDQEMVEKLELFKSLNYVENNNVKDEKARRFEAKKAQLRAKNRASAEKHRAQLRTVLPDSEENKTDSRPKRMIRITDTKKEEPNAKPFRAPEGTTKPGFKTDSVKKPLALFNFRTKN